MTSSNFEIRPVTAEEMNAFQALAKYAFAVNAAPDTPEEPETLMPEWSLAAFDGDKVVASSGGLPFKMRFNGNVVAADGVTAVSTDPGYRRKGAVRALITGLMHRARDNEVPVSILWASMGAIYQRFGYGLASTMVRYDIEPRYVQFQFGEPAGGHVRLLEKDEALPHCKAIYRAYCNDRTLLLHRAGVLWDIMFRRNENQNVNAAVYFDAEGRANTGREHVQASFDWHGPRISQPWNLERLIQLILQFLDGHAWPPLFLRLEINNGFDHGQRCGIGCRSSSAGLSKHTFHLGELLDYPIGHFE